MHRLAGNKDIEFIRVEHEFMGTAIIKRLPEVEHIMGCALVHIDDAGVVLAAIADQPVLAAGKIDRERNAAAGNIGHFGCDQRFGLMEHPKFAFIKLRAALAETDLRQARAGAHDDGEGARAHFQIERPLVTGGNLVKFLRTVSDDAREDIEPSGRAGLAEAESSGESARLSRSGTI